MSPQHDKHAEMRAKLSEGLKILSTASQEDTRSLNDALLKIHAALEDFVRLELAATAPHLREEVESKRTTWKTLIGYSKEHLGFSENDVQMITEANHQRQNVAHGGNYSGSLSELVTYAGFVQKWVNRDRTGAVELRPTPVAVPDTRAYAPPPPPPGTPGYDETPWHRSMPFLVLCFFILPPLWAILILTDRRQGGVAKLAAGAVLLMAGACVLGVTIYTWYAINPPSTAQSVPELREPTAPSEIPMVIGTEPSLQSLQPTATAAAEITCTIVWEEHPRDDLGGKTRSMVWNQVVEQQVQGSGMTPREFYDLVAEQNPELVADGYEFKRGKTYLLPRCG